MGETVEVRAKTRKLLHLRQNATAGAPEKQVVELDGERLNSGVDLLRLVGFNLLGCPIGHGPNGLHPNVMILHLMFISLD